MTYDEHNSWILPNIWLQLKCCKTYIQINSCDYFVFFYEFAYFMHIWDIRLCLKERLETMYKILFTTLLCFMVFSTVEVGGESSDALAEQEKEKS